MTESEKALSQFIAFANKHAPNKVDEIVPAISEMKKLVDRDVPKKPKEFTNLNNYFTSLCPNCNADDLDNFCKKCGQAIDWSES